MQNTYHGEIQILAQVDKDFQILHGEFPRVAKAKRLRGLVHRVDFVQHAENERRGFARSVVRLHDHVHARMP